MKESEPRKWIRLSVACEELGIGREMGRRMCVTGEWKARQPTGKPGGWWQVDPDDVARRKAKLAAESAQLV